MKRGKDEERMMGPMFPRLHVNDTEKGGPRAPPRNKMALYEQLSIPSQRFSRPVLPYTLSNTAAHLVPTSSQGVGNDSGMFFSHQLPPRHPSEEQLSQYSDSSTPLARVEPRKKLDEDDYRVPIFIHSVPSTEFDKFSNDVDREKLSPSIPPYFNHSLKFQRAKETVMHEHSMREEGKNQKGENSKELGVGWVKGTSTEKIEGLKKQTVSCLSLEPGDNPINSIDRLRTDDTACPELCAELQPSCDRPSTAVLGENVAEVTRRDSSNSMKALSSEDLNTVHDLSTDTGSREDGSCSSMQTGNLERGDSVSETSILDAMSGPDITPDDVVGMIGQKHFWKARKAIINQQRVFAVQVFELHRLIKVQRLMAASPNLLLDDSAYLGKPLKSLPGKQLPLGYAVKAIPQQKGDLEKQSHKKEGSAENTIEKASLSSAQNGVLPSSCRPMSNNLLNSPALSIIGSDHNARPRSFNQLQGHRWLIPVMSPSEGLVYKPYPGPPSPGFVGQACGGCGLPEPNPMMANFLTPAYGIPAPPYNLSTFPPHGCFPPPYGVPVMTTAAFSGSSVEQVNTSAIPAHSSQDHNSFTMPSQENGAVPDGLSRRASEDIEVQASTASSPSVRRPGRVASSAVEGRNMLPLFPTSPATNATKSSPQLRAPGRTSRVIKVVPHNALSASESAARIFQSIQEERKQYDSL